MKGVDFSTPLTKTLKYNIHEGLSTPLKTHKFMCNYVSTMLQKSSLKRTELFTIMM
jgi:hypothetical protein